GAARRDPVVRLVRRLLRDVFGSADARRLREAGAGTRALSRARDDDVRAGRLVQPAAAWSAGLLRAGYRFECSPTTFPAVSATSDMKPHSPMGVFGRRTRPPLAAARPSSMLQSSQRK